MEPTSNKFNSVLGKDLNSSNSYYIQRPELATSRKLSKMTGCLEIIGGEDTGQSKSCQDSQGNSRPCSSTSRSWSRGSVGSVPPRPDSSMSRRVNTPTKQISLQAVRRKEESAEPFVDQVDWQSLGLDSSQRKIWELGTSNADTETVKTLVRTESFRLESVVETSQHATKLSLMKLSRPEKEDMSQLKPHSDVTSIETTKEKEMSSVNKNRDEKSGEENDGDDSEDDDSDSSDEEEDKLMAPNELLMEFVDSLMRKDYQTACKLCKMILLYEPENAEALKFQPLIEEKLVLDTEAEKAAAGETDDDDDGSEDDEDDDSNDNSSDDEDSSSSDDDDSSDEEDDGDEGNGSNSNSNNNIWYGEKSRCCHFRD